MQTDPLVDAHLRAIDEDQINAGKPVLSVLVLMDDTGKPCPVFWDAVSRHNLRRPGESDDDLVARLTKAAHYYYGGPRGHG